ncbi:MAG: hypothetical protein AAB883_02715, partial [Patescibacteria group bacterium]
MPEEVTFDEEVVESRSTHPHKPGFSIPGVSNQSSSESSEKQKKIIRIAIIVVCFAASAVILYMSLS